MTGLEFEPRPFDCICHQCAALAYSNLLSNYSSLNPCFNFLKALTEFKNTKQHYEMNH